MVTKATSTKTTAYVPRLKAHYYKQYAGELMNDLGLANIHEVPRLEKIVLNVGLGRAKEDKKVMEAAGNSLRKITGQQPIPTIAKKSIASFKLREGAQIGLKVTLRDQRMYEFLDRLVNVVLPRLRDFHGTKGTSFDKSGNYSLGLPEQSVFPELTFEDTATPHGIQVVFTLRSQNSEHSRALLEKFGVPFEKNKEKNNG